MNLQLQPPPLSCYSCTDWVPPNILLLIWDSRCCSSSSVLSHQDSDLTQGRARQEEFCLLEVPHQKQTATTLPIRIKISGLQQSAFRGWELLGRDEGLWPNHQHSLFCRTPILPCPGSPQLCRQRQSWTEPLLCVLSKLTLHLQCGWACTLIYIHLSSSP